MAESTGQNQSIYRFRWVGYAFLLYALIDSILIFIPPQFEAPAWRLQILGKLVETVAIPLLGFALVFFGEFYSRTGVEKLFLRVASWFCLLLAIAFLLMIPMGILGTLQLDRQFAEFDPKAVERQITRQAAPLLAQIKLFEDQLNRSGADDIKRLGEQAKSLGISLDTQDPSKAKASLLSRIKQQREQTQAQINQQVQQQVNEVATKRLELNKNSMKWNLGALIAGVLFFVLWKTSRWAR